MPSEFLWTLVKNLNRAKYNKEALDDAIGEEEALVEMLGALQERIADATAATSSPKGDSKRRTAVFDQLAAFRVVDEMTAAATKEMNMIRKKERDVTQEVTEAAKMRVELALQLEALVGRSGVDAALNAKADLPLDEVLAELAAKRQSCFRWQTEHDSIKHKMSQVQQQNEQLVEECAALEAEVQALDKKVVLNSEIAALEQSITTLVKLVSIPRSL